MGRYTPPPRPELVRRVYALPREMVDRVHRYGYERGHQSEVEAVRELLQDALDRRAGGKTEKAGE